MMFHKHRLCGHTCRTLQKFRY